jgi:glycyl-tRNA synthetase
MAGIDGSIITNPLVWVASGHVASFKDVSINCKKCKKPNKIDKNEIGKAKCINCGGELDESSAKELNMMLSTQVGPLRETSTMSYLRPETAQLIFADFKFVQNDARMKLPFGIAQIGKAFRNEIAPRDFMFRCREFEQMEIEYFVDPAEKCPYEIGESEVLVYSAEMQENKKEPVKMKFKEALKKGIIKTDWHAYWLEQEFLWFTELGANADKFRIRQHMNDEKSHYALDTWDLQYKFPFGWSELQGMANRTDFDLKQHQLHSKVNLEILNKDGKKILPHVVCEPSQGVERAFLVFMFDAYNFDEKRQNIILKLHPRLAPVKAAVFPMMKDEKYEKIAEEIVRDLRKEWNIAYDYSGSIGKRYSRNDEIGTIACITVDEQTPDDQKVTVRDRNTTEQIRIKISELRDMLRQVINDDKCILDFGVKVNTRVK